MQVLKYFQETLVQYLLGLFRGSRIPEANAFGVPKELFEQHPLRLRILHPAGFNDTDEVIVRESALTEQQQSDV